MRLLFRSMNDASAIYGHIVHSLADTDWLTQDRRADRGLVPRTTKGKRPQEVDAGVSNRQHW